MASNAGQSRSIEVVIRVRPLNGRERDQGDTIAVTVASNNALQVVVGKNANHETDIRDFSFDFCYGIESDQLRVFNDLGHSLLQGATEGYNACLFAYGQTGAGKSWSILGNEKSPTDRGLLPRICEGLFANLSDNASVESSRVVCTYLEIYNEKIKDLLSEDSEDHPKGLDIRQTANGGAYVADLSEALVQSYTDVQSLLEKGHGNRHVTATAMNAQSSRSHAVFTVRVGQTLNGGTRRNAQLNIVDLAGSERQSKTKAGGDTLKEGANINQSLTVLGQVIFALADAKKKGHVPFRNSKLTHLLKDSLSGNSKTVMIAAVSPTDSNVTETLSTLRFAQSVKKVKTVVVKNETSDRSKDQLIQQLRLEIEDMKAQRDAQPVLTSREPSDQIAVRRVSTITSVEPCIQQDAGSNWNQSDCFLAQVEVLEECINKSGTDDEKAIFEDIAQRFASLSSLCESINFYMAWMMEYNFMPKGDGDSRWTPTIKWEVSKTGPNLLGTLRVCLLDEIEDGSRYQVIQNFSEDEFHKVWKKFETKYEECTIILNERGSQQTRSKEESNGQKESVKSGGNPQTLTQQENGGANGEGRIGSKTVTVERIKEEVDKPKKKLKSAINAVKTTNALASAVKKTPAAKASSAANSPGNADSEEMERLRNENERLIDRVKDCDIEVERLNAKIKELEEKNKELEGTKPKASEEKPNAVQKAANVPPAIPKTAAKAKAAAEKPKVAEKSKPAPKTRVTTAGKAAARATTLPPPKKIAETTQNVEDSDLQLGRASSRSMNSIHEDDFKPEIEVPTE